MASYGDIDTLDIGDDNWMDYIARIKRYFLDNNISNEKKQTAIFLTVIASSTYSLVTNLLSPEKIANTPIKEIADELKKQLCPEPTEIAERFKFYERYQQKGETLENYIGNLRELAKFCNFGRFLEDMLRDRYVCGLQNDKIRKRLLSQEDLTLKKALELSQYLDKIKTEDSMIQKREIKKEKKLRFQIKTGAKKKCYRCYGEGHFAIACKFKEAICKKCNGKGHIAKACRRANQTCMLKDSKVEPWTYASVDRKSSTDSYQTCCTVDDDNSNMMLYHDDDDGVVCYAHNEFDRPLFNERNS